MGEREQTRRGLQNIQEESFCYPKRCTNTFDLGCVEVQKYKKRLSKLVLFTDKKQKKSKKGSNRREKEKKGYNKDHSKSRRTM